MACQDSSNHFFLSIFRACADIFRAKVEMGLIKLKYITHVRCKQRKRYCAGQSLQKIMNDNNEQPAEIVLSVLQDETSH